MFVDDDQPAISVDTKKSAWVVTHAGVMKCWSGLPGVVVVSLLVLCEPARSLARGSSGPGIVAVSTNRRLV